jgi:YidC/Oxa1 family membrane protein insertase
MFTTLIVQPIFNLLVLIYALIPGHNFGVALILFTIVIRLLMWPLVKRQLRQTKAMRKLQPELRRIKKESKGNRQKESLMLMELYKERGVNPLGTIPILIVQFIILIGLYFGLLKVIQDPKNIVEFAYPALQNLAWMQHIAENIKAFDETFLGFIDLTRPALSSEGVYIPALMLVIGSAVVQFLTSRQLMPVDKDARKLRHILKEAGSGKQADQYEINAAIGRSTQYIIPLMVFIFTINLAAALSLYWLVGGIVAYIQQSVALRDDEAELEKMADEPEKPSKKDKKEKKDVSQIAEAEVVTETKPAPKPKPKKSSKKKAGKKRRR